MLCVVPFASEILKYRNEVNGRTTWLFGSKGQNGMNGKSEVTQGDVM
jgi:hypothetical protein